MDCFTLLWGSQYVLLVLLPQRAIPSGVSDRLSIHSLHSSAETSVLHVLSILCHWIAVLHTRVCRLLSARVSHLAVC